MKLGSNRLSIKSQTYMVPGKEQSLEDLISLAESQGLVILSIDRENNRLLIGETELAP